MAWLGGCLGLPLPILRKGAADIHDLVEAAFFVPPHVPLVSPGID
jgi:hypothetical protein